MNKYRNVSSIKYVFLNSKVHIHPIKMLIMGKFGVYLEKL